MVACSFAAQRGTRGVGIKKSSGGVFVRQVGTARRFFATNVKRFICYVELSCCVALSS